jgi:hypothetical protein
MYAVREDGWATRSMDPKLSDERHVRRATSADVSSLARVIGCAFADDPFYARHGFEVVHVVEDERWPTFWSMRREPVAPR